MKKLLVFSFVVFIATSILCESALSRPRIKIRHKSKSSGFASGIIAGNLISKKAKSNDKETKNNWNYIFVEKENCFMDTKNFMLYKYSVITPDIKHLDGVKNSKIFCEVEEGVWLVNDCKNNKIEIEYDKNNISVDFIIPFSFLEKQIDKDNKDLVYNYIPNLELVYEQKNRKICDNKYIRVRQKQICQKMNKDLNLSLKCNEL